MIYIYIYWNCESAQQFPRGRAQPARCPGAFTWLAGLLNQGPGHVFFAICWRSRELGVSVAGEKNTVQKNIMTEYPWFAKKKYVPTWRAAGAPKKKKTPRRSRVGIFSSGIFFCAQNHNGIIYRGEAGSLTKMHRLFPAPH